MKKYSPYIFILLIVICISFPLISYAEPSNTTGASYGDSVGNFGSWLLNLSAGAASKIISPILSAIAYAIMKILSFFLGISGLILNGVLNMTVVNMSSGIKSITGINVAWKITRDLMNIGFIFMLLYQGIMLIISRDDIGSIRKFITGIILASLFINFSLFFTKVIIDSSNIITIGLYNTIIEDQSSQSTSYDRGLANKLMRSLGIQAFWSMDVITTNSSDTENGQLMANVMACILIIITTFIFLAVSVMFVVRYIVLIVLLALSPIAYMGLAFPQMKGYASKWWDTLMGQVIFGPLFMFMMLIIMTLLAGNFATINTTVVDAEDTFLQKSAQDMAEVVLNFSLVIGLMILALITSKKYATQGAGIAGDLNKRFSSFAGGALLGGAAGLGRRTIGAAANSGANNEKLQARAANGSIMAQAQLAAYRYGAKSSFDARKSGIAEATGVSLGKGTEGIPFLGNAKAGEGGYKKTLEEREKKEKTYIESLKPSDEAANAYKKQAKTDAKRILGSEEALKKYEDMSEDARREYFVQNPKEIETYMQAKADVERMKEIKALDEDKRKKHYEENPEEEVEFRRKEKELTDAAAAAKTAEETAKTALDAKVAESKARIDKLTSELRTAERNSQFGLGTAEEALALKTAQDSLKAETDKQKNLDKEVEQEKKALESKVTARKNAEKAVTDNALAEKNTRMEILSDEHRALVADSQEKGQSLYQKRGEAYANSLQTAAYNPTRLWRGSQSNKAAAAAVRKAVKGKSNEQQISDAIKKMLKEEDKKPEEAVKTETTASTTKEEAA